MPCMVRIQTKNTGHLGLRWVAVSYQKRSHLWVLAAIAGCSPSLGDVSKAVSRNDGSALIALLNEADGPVRIAALEGLRDVGSEDQLVQVLRWYVSGEAFEKGSHQAHDLVTCALSPPPTGNAGCVSSSALLQAATGACTREPRMASTLNDMLMGPWSDPRLWPVIADGLNTACPAALAALVDVEAENLRAQFSNVLPAAMNRVRLFMPRDISANNRAAIFDALVEIALSSLESDAPERLAYVREAIALGKDESETHEFGCAVMTRLTNSIPSLLGQSELIDGFAPSMHAGCSAHEDWVGAIDAEVKTYREWARACTGAPPCAETQLALTRLVGAARVLRWLDAVEATDSLESRAVAAVAQGRAIEERISGISGVEGQIESLQERIGELRERRRDFRYLEGYIIAHTDGIYEISVGGRRALLTTLTREYSSRGYFSLWVVDMGKQTIRTVNGFDQQWTSYLEADQGARKELDSDIAEAERDLTRKRAESKSSSRTLTQETKSYARDAQKLVADFDRALQQRRARVGMTASNRSP